MKKNEWMTGFYGLDWFEIEAGDVPGDLPGNCLLEWRITPDDTAALMAACDGGFALVETAMEFETVVGPEPGELAGIRPIQEDDLDQVLSITRSCFVDNDQMQNRFKNRRFFTPEQTWAYYKASVVNCLGSGNGVGVVYKQENQVVAYYLAREVAPSRYKGVMTAVMPVARGQHLHTRMQQATFNLIGEPITIINSTQLSNRSTLASHIRNGRHLGQVNHIFLKRQ